MAKTPLFSTYRQGENRVTSSMLAVFERIDAGIVERILAAASGESALAFVNFANQLEGTPGSVPDASISASFRYLFEVKTARNAVDPGQLAKHLQHLDGTFRDERLFVVTPDAVAPIELAALDDPRAIWLNFLAVSLAIDDVLADSLELVSEQSRFLLRELQALFAQDGLLDPQEDVVIVAARRAYGEYLAHGAYVCQPRRAFRTGLERLAFYKDGAVQREVPSILARRDNVDLRRETAQALMASSDQTDLEIGRLVDRLLNAGVEQEGTPCQLFMLSPRDDPRTMTLAAAIRNTKVGSNGKLVPFLRGQRYTRTDVLASHPATTSELEARGG